MSNNDSHPAIVLTAFLTFCGILVSCSHPQSDEVATETPQAIRIKIVQHNALLSELLFLHPRLETVNGEILGGHFSPAHFFVSVDNETERSLRLFSPEFSFGYADLWFQMESGRSTNDITKKGGIVWTRNFPLQTVLSPRSSTLLPVCLDQEYWNDAPKILFDAFGAVTNDPIRIRAILTNGVQMIDGNLIWANPHVLTSKWTDIRLQGPELASGLL